MLYRIPILLLVLMFLPDTIASAHHSYAAEFDANAPATIEGEVVEVWFKNPHVRYYVKVVNEDGSETIWYTRGLSPVKLVGDGWT